MNAEYVARFWDKVIKTKSCWKWTASKSKFGYGVFKFGDKAMNAHRFAWILEHGKIPKKMFVCHSCDNPECTRQDHLFLGTHQINVTDCCKKNRQSKGEDRHTAKLTEKQVKLIRKTYKKGVRGFGFRRIADQYGVRNSTIMRIVQRRNWKHVK